MVAVLEITFTDAFVMKETDVVVIDNRLLLSIFSSS